MILTKNSRILISRHKDFAHLNIGIDLSELWDGAPDEKQGNVNWSGGYRGRPLLAEQIFPAIKTSLQYAKPRNIRDYITNIRMFFRFLDAYEVWAAQQNSSTFSTEIKTFTDISTHHLQMWKTPSPKGEWKQANWNSYRGTTQVLRIAAERLNLTHLKFPSFTRNDPVDRSDIPDEKIGKLLVKALAKEVNAIFSHWERSDKLALIGRDLIDIEKMLLPRGQRTIVVEGGISEADLHATYRAAVAANNDMPLDKSGFLKALGCKRTSHTPWWPNYGPDHQMVGKRVELIGIQSGLYPTHDQISVLFILFLARTGWNQSTAELLDTINDNEWCKEYTKKFIWLFSYKPRSRQWQDTVSIKKHRTGAYQIIVRLLARTYKLRCALKVKPSLCTNSKIGERSPWLYQRTIQVQQTPIRVEIDSAELNRALRRVIASHNAQQKNDDMQIPMSLAVGDLRDIFAASTFANSGFSIFLTQLALGHKKSTTTFHYLRRRAWRAESEMKKNEMFVSLIDQIETHRVIDLTLLRAKMDGVTVTEQQIGRLEAYREHRTYVGMGCSEPTNPPAYIDPSNPCDGSTPCAQGHLCAGCPKGRVFNDSLPYLSRRSAELQWLRDTLQLEVFEDSSLADQFLVMRATLVQWPAEEVACQEEYWTARIASGEHRPIRFSGEH